MVGTREEWEVVEASPWALRTLYGGIIVICLGEGNRERARQIAREHNMHGRMLEACKRMEALEVETQHHGGVFLKRDCPSLRWVIRKARALVAEAEKATEGEGGV